MSFLLGPCLFWGANCSIFGVFFTHWTENDQTITSWWLNQPIWKIWSSNWIISPGFGLKITNVWVATNQINTIRPALEQEHIDTNRGDQKLMDHQDQLCPKGFVALLHLLSHHKETIPNNPCMAYFPTFTIKFNQMYVNIPYTDGMGMVINGWTYWALKKMNKSIFQIVSTSLQFRKRPLQVSIEYCYLLKASSTSFAYMTAHRETLLQHWNWVSVCQTKDSWVFFFQRNYILPFTLRDWVICKVVCVYVKIRICSQCSTPTKLNTAPEKMMGLEDKPFLSGPGNFSGVKC